MRRLRVETGPRPRDLRRESQFSADAVKSLDSAHRFTQYSFGVKSLERHGGDHYENSLIQRPAETSIGGVPTTCFTRAITNCGWSVEAVLSPRTETVQIPR